MLNKKKDDDRCCRILDAELVNLKKEEDRRRRILDMNSSSDDDDYQDEASFGAVRVPFVDDGSTRAGVLNLAPINDNHVMNLLKDCGRLLVAGCDEEESIVDEILHDEVLFVPDLEDPTKFRDPLSYFDPDVLHVLKKAMQQQVDQKKVELRNLGMEVPDDHTIFEGLDVCSSFGLFSEALEKDPATSKKNHHRN
jgi:hypothetical protein